jgi:hypothetical protein
VGGPELLLCLFVSTCDDADCFRFQLPFARGISCSAIILVVIEFGFKSLGVFHKVSPFLFIIGL